jgi:hypothetical protein
MSRPGPWSACARGDTDHPGRHVLLPCRRECVLQDPSNGLVPPAPVRQVARGCRIEHQLHRIAAIGVHHALPRTLAAVVTRATQGGVARRCRRSATRVVDVRHDLTSTHRRQRTQQAREDGGVLGGCRRSATPVVDVQHDPTSTHRRQRPGAARRTRPGRTVVSRGVSQIGDTCRRCATGPGEHPPPLVPGRHDAPGPGGRCRVTTAGHAPSGRGVAGRCRRSATPVVDVRHDPTSTSRRQRRPRRPARRGGAPAAEHGDRSLVLVARRP